MLETLLDLLFPRTSLSGEEGAWTTEEECKQIAGMLPVRYHRQLLRKRGLRYVDEIVAAGSYHASPLLRKAIHSYKYTRIRSLHRELAPLMVAAIPGLLSTNRNERMRSEQSVTPVLCPVPLHWTRRFQRGFNQAELLAQCIGDATSWKIAPLLKRRIPTGYQAWRSRNERIHALDNAFRYVGPARHPPPFVVLIDDLCTTGTTLNECARTLKAAGVRRVHALVLAHG